MWPRYSFDKRAQEAALNAYPQFKVKLHDIDVYYLQVLGRGPSPMPLLLRHAQNASNIANDKMRCGNLLSGGEHQIANTGSEDLVYLGIGANSPNEIRAYPDSGKVM